MLHNNLIAIGTFFALRIRLQILLWLLLLVCFIIVHGDGFDVNFVIAIQDKCLDINEPPVSSLIFDEVTHKLLELYFEVSGHKIHNIFHILQCFICVLFTHILYSSKCFTVFSVHYKLGQFMHFCL